MKIVNFPALSQLGGRSKSNAEIKAPNKIVASGLRFTNLAALAILILSFSLFAPGFNTVISFSNILDATAAFLLLALGEGFVMIAGGIDLSVGSMLSLGGVASASYMSAHFTGGHGTLITFVGVLVGSGVGLVGGALNGAIIAYMKISPLIVTLGTLGIFVGVADLISNGLPIGDLPPASFTLGNGQLWYIPYPALIGIVIALILWFVAVNTRFGRYCYAIGANSEAARRAGVNLHRHSIILYGLAGTLAGLAGVLNAAHFGSATSNAGANALLVAIAAVVIGGTPITGGEGDVWGWVIGALIYTLLQNGFVLMGVAAFWQLVVIGVLIIAAVYLDEYQRRLRSTVAPAHELEGITVERDV